MTGEELLAIAGIVVSLIFEYFPRLSVWYNALEDNVQRLIMLGVVAVIALTVFGMSCAGLSEAYTCDKAGVWSLIKIFVAGVIANQTTYLISPKRAQAQPVVE